MLAAELVLLDFTLRSLTSRPRQTPSCQQHGRGNANTAASAGSSHTAAASSPTECHHGGRQQLERFCAERLERGATYDQTFRSTSSDLKRSDGLQRKPWTEMVDRSSFARPTNLTEVCCVSAKG